MTDQAQVEIQGFDIDNMSVDSGPVTHSVSVIDDVDGNSVSGFVIVGKNSNEYQSAVRAIRIENIKRAAKRKTQIDSSTDEGAAFIARTVDQSDRTTALAVTVGWYGMNSGGKPMAFDKMVVERMFQRYPTWQQKVLAALEEDANFIKP